MNLLSIEPFHVDADVGQAGFHILNVHSVWSYYTLMLLVEVIVCVRILYIAHIWTPLLLAEDLSVCIILKCASAVLTSLTSPGVAAQDASGVG